MMDGRIGAMRAALEGAGHHKYDDPQLFRQICLCVLWPVSRCGRGSGRLTGDKKTYQMDPANADEAMRLDRTAICAKGRDMVMVKPGMPYLDICRRVKTRSGARPCLSSVGRIRDDQGRRPETGGSTKKGHDGKPDGFQTRRMRRRSDLFRTGSRAFDGGFALKLLAYKARMGGEIAADSRR